MTKKRIGKALLSLLLTCAMLCGLTSPLARPLQTQALSLEDLQAEKEALAERAEELQAQKDALSGSLADQKQRKTYIEEQIEIKRQEIELNQQLIDTISAQIAEKDAEISAAEEKVSATEDEISDRFSQLQERLRTISKTGNLSTLQMLMSTDDYVDYLLKSKIMKQIATNDQELIDGLEEEIARINKEREKLTDSKAELEAQKAQLVEVQEEADLAKSELDGLLYEVQLLMNDLQSDLEYYNSMLEQVLADEEALEAEIDRIIAESQIPDTVLSGKLYWPSFTCTLVTDTFGGRYLDGAYNFHKGVDLACYGSAYGADIIAAADGMVIYVNTWDSWGSGYGYYLMIDHGYDESGRHIVTLYAHCSSILVSEGDWVTGGETQVAEVGNTGWSYGAHLHFEVRVDGEPEDPLTNGWIAI